MNRNNNNNIPSNIRNTNIGDELSNMLSNSGANLMDYGLDTSNPNLFSANTQERAQATIGMLRDTLTRQQLAQTNNVPLNQNIPTEISRSIQGAVNQIIGQLTQSGQSSDLSLAKRLSSVGNRFNANINPQQMSQALNSAFDKMSDNHGTLLEFDDISPLASGSHKNLNNKFYQGQVSLPDGLPTPINSEAEYSAMSRTEFERRQETQRINDFARRNRVLAGGARTEKELNNELSPETKNQIKSAIGETDERLKTLFVQFKEAERSGDTESMQNITMGMNQVRNNKTELENLLENDRRKTLDFVSKIAGIVGVGAIANRVLFQDVMNYQIRPATQVMSNQGPLGAVLGSSILDSQQYAMNINQGAMNSGGAAALGGLMTGGAKGNMMAAGGAVLGVLGATGLFDNLLSGIGLAKKPEEIITTNMVSQLMNPNAFTNRARVARGSLAEDGGADLGFLLGDDASSMLKSGQRSSYNTVLDQYANGRFNLFSGGMSGDDLAQLAQSTSGTLRGTFAERTSMANFAGGSAVSYGVSTDEMLGNMASLQGAGSKNAEQSMLRLITAAGGPSAYTMNAVLPALSRVVESTSIRNIARSAEESEKSVAGIYSSIVNSNQDTKLKAILQNNPEFMGQLMSSFETSIQGIKNNPAMLARQLAGGRSYGDFITNDPQIVLDEINRYKRILNNGGGIGMNNAAQIEQFAKNMNMDTGLFMSLLQQDNLSVDDVTEGMKSSQQKMEDTFAKITESQINQLVAGPAEQIDIMAGAGQAAADQLLTLQQKMMDFASSDAIINLLTQRIDEITNNINSLLGIEPVISQTNLNNMSSNLNFDANAVGQVTKNQSDNISVDLQGLLQSKQYRDGTVGMNSEDLNKLHTQMALATKQGQIGSASDALNLNVVQNFKTTGSIFPGSDDLTHPKLKQFAVGGYTGAGGRTEPVGYVHGGEYVISDAYAKDNMELLERIQSGEKVDGRGVSTSSSISGTDEDLTLTLRITGKTDKDIVKMTEKAVEEYVRRNKLHYN